MEAPSLHDTDKNTRLKETSWTKFAKMGPSTSAIKGRNADSKHVWGD